MRRNQNRQDPYDGAMRNRGPVSARLRAIEERLNDLPRSHQQYDTLNQLANLIRTTERRLGTERNEMFRTIFRPHLQNLFGAAETLIQQLFPQNDQDQQQQMNE